MNIILTSKLRWRVRGGERILQQWWWHTTDAFGIWVDVPIEYDVKP